MSKPASPPWFVDIAAASGLDFVHTTGATGEYYFPEIAGSGCALFDYDNDGDLDVYAVQSYPLDPKKKEEAAAKGLGRDRLYRNDLTLGGDGRGVPRFVDVTDASGLGDAGYGMGVAVGDYDNDGDLDVFVSNFGPNSLYRNNGDGTFADVSGSAIDRDRRWGTSASFFDYDRDGFLDLYVANYVDFNVNENRICHSRSSRRDYCGPSTFKPLPDRLYHNNRDGTFTDVTTATGIDTAFGSGLGVACADFNGDGGPDVYVANDGDANQLWINNGDPAAPRFTNTALLAGAAYNAAGMAEAGMGVAAGDFDRDGDEDLFISHLVGEHNTLFVGDGRGNFEDRTDAHGLGAMSRVFTGFGTEWFDYDHDGWLDLFVANGAVRIIESRATEPNPFDMPNLLIRNTGPPAFRLEDVSSQAGPDVTRLLVSRGAAFGDVDNDGDIDILVSTSNGPLQLLRNDVGSRRSWLMLRLEGTKSNRSAIGAIVELSPVGGRRRARVHADGSYCSANDLRVHFGLGDDEGEQAATVTWPSGLVERFERIPARRVSTLREGEGRR